MPQNLEGSEGTYTVTVSGEGMNVERILDREAALEVIALVVGGGVPSRASPRPSGGRQRRPARRTGGEGGEAPKPRRRRSGGPSVLKDLSLSPTGKKAFKTFATEKAPKHHHQKQVRAT